MDIHFIDWEEKSLKWLFVWGQQRRRAVYLDENRFIQISYGSYYSPLYLFYSSMRYRIIGLLINILKIKIDNRDS